MKFLKLLLLLPIIALCSGCIGGEVENPPKKDLSLGTGGVGGVYYNYGTELAKLIHADKKILPITVKTTPGSGANVRLLQEKVLDLGIVQSDTLSNAINGQGAFADVGKGSGYAAVAAVYTEVCQVVVPKNSDIKTINDLVGKKVSVSEQGSGSMQNAEQILATHGLSFDKLTPVYMTFMEAATALQEGEIDAFFVTSIVPASPIVLLADNLEVRVLPISKDVQDKMTKTYGGYTHYTIPANTYKGQTEEISTIGVKAVLIASPDLKDEDIAYLTEFILTNADKLPHDENVKFDVNFAVEDVPAPFHSGAAKYYKSQGVTVDVYNGKN